jgi:hypothetical protein
MSGHNDERTEQCLQQQDPHDNGKSGFAGIWIWAQGK